MTSRDTPKADCDVGMFADTVSGAGQTQLRVETVMMYEHAPQQ
jgi:hypothetical protein